jgi:hypothetical protein
VLSVAVTAAFGAPVARADDTPAETATPGIATISPQTLTVAADLARTDKQIAQLKDDIDRASNNLATAQAAVSVFDGLVATSQPGIERARQRVSTDAVTAYTSHSVAASSQLAVTGARDFGRADQYLSATVVVDGTSVKELAAMQQRLGELRMDTVAARGKVADSVAELQESRGRLVDLRAKLQKELDEFGVVPVMGTAWVTAPQLAAWFRSTGTTPKLAPGTTIDDLARAYIQEGSDEGVRGDLAFAQAIVESAYFTVAAGNNYSGIGACDSCDGGLPFADPRAGVRAQIQLLRNYADPTSRATNLAHAPEPGLYGADPVRAASLYDSFFLKGKAPLWNQMGNGNWATDPWYAGKVIGLFARILVFAQQHPNPSPAPD